MSPAAREAVERAIKKTGYRINPHARNLATARANSIAFLLTESQDRLFEDPNFSTLMRGAADALAEHDLTLVLLMAGSDDEQRRATDFIMAGHVDGALLVSSHRGREGFLKTSSRPRCRSSRAACRSATSGASATSPPTTSTARATSWRTCAIPGARTIATITGPLDTSGGIGRLDGYRSELGDESTSGSWPRATTRGRAACRAMTELLERAPDLDAVFVANDLMAAGALDVLRERGLGCPRTSRWRASTTPRSRPRVQPALTTMRQPFDRIARRWSGCCST